MKAKVKARGYITMIHTSPRIHSSSNIERKHGSNNESHLVSIKSQKRVYEHRLARPPGPKEGKGMQRKESTASIKPLERDRLLAPKRKKGREKKTKVVVNNFTKVFGAARWRAEEMGGGLDGWLYMQVNC
jgi:hypothetical protein